MYHLPSDDADEGRRRVSADRLAQVLRPHHGMGDPVVTEAEEDKAFDRAVNEAEMEMVQTYMKRLAPEVFLAAAVSMAEGLMAAAVELVICDVRPEMKELVLVLADNLQRLAIDARRRLGEKEN